MTFIYILVTLFVLGLCILFHELGHFISALSVGAIVKEFSIGFGPPVKTWHYKGIKFSLRSLFLGGYVKILGDDPNDPEKDNPRSFKNLGFWRRFLILISGVFSNLFFAFLILLFINWIGYQAPVSPIEVRGIESESPAAQAGIEKYDIIYEINGQEIRQSEDLLRYLQEREEEVVNLAILRNERSINLEAVPAYDEERGQYLLGVHIRPYLSAVVQNVQVNTPARQAGIEKGDVLYKVEGNRVYSYNHFEELILEEGGDEARITVLRDGEEIDKTLRVETITIRGQKMANIGVEPQFFDEEKVRHSFLESAWGSVLMIGTLIEYNVVAVAALIRGSLPVRESLGGPVQIVQLGAHQAQMGPIVFWRFMALLNVVLFLFNLLPIPVLDGGHILFLVVEKVIRRPIPHAVQAFVTQIFFVLLLALFLFVTFNDILRLFS